MKIKAPSLSPGKRSALERTLKKLMNLGSELDPPKARLDELRLVLSKAESRKAESKKGAALSSDAAMALAGAEAQLSQLAPQVMELQRAVERQIATAIQQVNNVRRTEVRELLFGPFIEQLKMSIADSLKPFFDDADWATHYAGQIMQWSNSYNRLTSYLNRPPTDTIEFDGAKREIDALVEEIENILAGKTLLEV